jgi:pimeloyl-ACP methyl ester carboxylesterase
MAKMKSITALLVFLAVPCIGGQAPWGQLPPSVTLPVQPTQLSIPRKVVKRFEKDISQQRDFQITWENSQTDRRFGVDHEWMTTALQHWRDQFSWRDVEASVNRHPHFMANLTVDATELQIHFMALFSKKRDAIPIAFFHGWPGSFLEFIDIFEIVKSQYDPESSPYHLVVPSLPGFTFSSGPPIDSNWGIANTSAVMDSLLQGLGFGEGYVAQGGDIGSFVAQTLALSSPSCKGK